LVGMDLAGLARPGWTWVALVEGWLILPVEKSRLAAWDTRHRATTNTGRPGSTTGARWLRPEALKKRALGPPYPPSGIRRVSAISAATADSFRFECEERRRR
jgi:hypothetical protein